MAFKAQPKLVPFKPQHVTVYPPGVSHSIRPGEAAFIPEAHLEEVSAHDAKQALAHKDRVNAAAKVEADFAKARTEKKAAKEAARAEAASGKRAVEASEKTTVPETPQHDQSEES